MSIRKEFEAWKRENPDQHGSRAYQRFVMLKFLERVTRSDDFIFKGGNLLWFYIKTPRPTIDLDLATSIETDSEAVIEYLKSVSSLEGGISFNVDNYKVVKENGKIGLGVTISYKDEAGGNNKFGVDIVLGVATDMNKIRINKQLVNAASIENIILDKLSACYQFKGGNTRAKDYDDLIRISQTGMDINYKKLRKLAQLRNIPLLPLDYDWLPGDLEEAWISHVGYDKKEFLPRSIKTVFDMVNNFIDQLKTS